MWKLTLPTVVCFLCLAFRVVGQHIPVSNTVLDKHEKLEARIEVLENFSINFPQEKVYLHFDNTSYRQGDDIWFAAYVVEPGENRLSNLSKTLYVELLTPGGEVISKRVLRVGNGRCHGDFKLDRIPFYSGFYEVRAYTKYMLNFGEGAIFSRLLPVFDKPAEPGDREEKKMLDYRYIGSFHNYPVKRQAPERGREVNVRFFPEGGSLVRGVTSRVAFEATDKFGNPIEVTGVVPGDSTTGDGGATFATTHEGRGVFDFTPAAADPADPKTTPKPARVEVVHEGRTHRFELPAAVPQGIVMAVDNLSDPANIAVSLRRNAQTPEITLGVAVLSGGRLHDALMVNVKRERVDFRIDKTTLPAGVAQVVLFDSDGAIVADRPVFIPPRPEHTISIAAKTSKPTCLPHEKIEIDFSVTDHTGRPVLVPFSLAVRDGADEIAARGNAMTDLLLMSEIKGYVRRPKYYFEEPGDPVRAAQLDELLMVQGWRRYKWTHIAGLAPFEHEYIPEQGIEIQGQVVREKLLSDKKPPSPETNVSFLMTPVKNEVPQPEQPTHADTLATDTPTDIPTDTEAVTGYAETDSLGRFSLVSNAEGRWHMIMSAAAEEKKKRSYQIILDRVITLTPRRYAYTDLIADIAIEEASDESEAAVGTEEERDENPTAWLDSVVQTKIGKGVHRINAVTVKAKRSYREWEASNSKETSIMYYDAKEEIDDLYDRGDYYQGTNINALLMNLDKNFHSIHYCGYSFLLYNSAKKMALVVVNYEKVNVVDLDMGLFNYLRYRPEDIKSIYINDKPAVIARYIMPTRYASSMSLAQNFNCVVLLETFPLDKMPALADRSVRKTYLEGYYSPRPFSGPDYDVVPPDEGDYRRTLYWNPEVAPDSLGRAQVGFHNNSRTGSLTVSAETITPDGRIGANLKINKTGD